MTDWAVGDLALCVDASIHECTVTWIAAMPETGKVYTVMDLFADGPDLNLVLEELHRACGIGLRAWRFRKIRPDEHEPCEEEFAKLLNLSRRVRTFDQEVEALVRDHGEYRERLGRVK